MKYVIGLFISSILYSNPLLATTTYTEYNTLPPMGMTYTYSVNTGDTNIINFRISAEMYIQYSGWNDEWFDVLCGPSSCSYNLDSYNNNVSWDNADSLINGYTPIFFYGLRVTSNSLQFNIKNNIPKYDRMYDVLDYINYIDSFVQVETDAPAVGYTAGVIREYMPDGSVVPEPASWALLIAGFGVVGLAARRREKRLARV